MKKVNCILLIDDNEADNYLHSKAILSTGVFNHLEVATGGEAALAYLQKAGDNAAPKPDLIFLDINMPGMDGFEFLEEYHKLDPALKSQMVVFMLTSSLMPEDNEKAMNSGEVSDFLNKPLTEETVQKIVEKCF